MTYNILDLFSAAGGADGRPKMRSVTSAEFVGRQLMAQLVGVAA